MALTDFLRDNPVDTIFDLEEESTKFKFFVKYYENEVHFLEYDQKFSKYITFWNES